METHTDNSAVKIGMSSPTFAELFHDFASVHEKLVIEKLRSAMESRGKAGSIGPKGGEITMHGSLAEKDTFMSMDLKRLGFGPEWGLDRSCVSGEDCWSLKLVVFKRPTNPNEPLK